MTSSTSFHFFARMLIMSPSAFFNFFKDYIVNNIRFWLITLSLPNISRSPLSESKASAIAVLSYEILS